MALGDNQIMQQAAPYVSKVNSAANKCEDAAQSVQTVMKCIENYWTGASGEAMEEALRSVKQELLSIADELEKLAKNMKTHAGSITMDEET